MLDLIDSHVHLDLTYAGQPDRLDWIKKYHYLPVSWAFGARINTTDDLANYLTFQKATIHGISNAGIPCYYLSGIHPRNIPNDLDVSQIPKILGPYLDDPLCRGIGEIGLETGSDQEIDVLTAQMEMAYTLINKEKIFGIHTPRNNKQTITSQLLSILDPFLSMKDHMVIDHCTPDTIGEVLKRGYWAGITVSPVKSSESDIIEILNKYEKYSNRIMVNTDSGGQFFEDLFQLSESPNIEETIKRQILKENALTFFKL